MCLITIAYKCHPKYKLILLANRDEFYQRPTQAAHWWEEDKTVFGGKDLQAGGSWLAVSKKGKIGAITNYRMLSRVIKNKITRGKILGDYMLSNTSVNDYIHSVSASSENYEGYNLLLGNIEEMHHFSNISKKLTPLKPGIHALSNHLLDTPWPKVERAKQFMNLLLQTEDKVSVEQAFKLFSDKEIAPDNQLPDTGIGINYERYLSSVFIDIPGYGTRATTILLVDHENKVYFEEREHVLNTISTAYFRVIE